MRILKRLGTRESSLYIYPKKSSYRTSIADYPTILVSNIVNKYDGDGKAGQALDRVIC